MNAPDGEWGPGWAYDDDGYCVICGNGEWKPHHPDCALADFIDASAELRARAEKAEAEVAQWEEAALQQARFHADSLALQRRIFDGQLDELRAERDRLRVGIQALADREGRIHKPGPVFMDNGGRACVSCHNWWPCQPLKGLRGLLSPTPEGPTT